MTRFGKVGITIEYDGPHARHNLVCWICEVRPAVYFMGPMWHFRPCWDCQRYIREGMPLRSRIAHWAARMVGAA